VNLGLLGGTFDPPHLGHLHLARAAEEELGLDGILFIPCHRQPLKPNPPEASSWHRCAMLALALEGKPAWEICTLEVERGTVAFTADTLDLLAEIRPGDSWTLLLGADSLESLPMWHRWADILRRARVAVAPRETGVPVRVPEAIRGLGPVVLAAPAVPIQSSAIRRDLREGRDESDGLPPAVREYVTRQRLYRGGPSSEAATPSTKENP
jgi:nicotinate-nucleotide adenylyltransferase